MPENNVRTVDILLYVKINGDISFDPHINEDGEIVLIPKSKESMFTSVVRAVDGVEKKEDEFEVRLTANMNGSDNFDYFCDIDDIGLLYITPEDENTSFESVTTGESLNLVTESRHLQVCEECIEEDFETDETPYTREEVEKDLQSLTMNWTKEDTLKTGFEVEHQYAMEILSQHYETVYDEGKKGSWYYIRFVGPMNESLNEANDGDVAKKAFLDMFEDVEKQLEDLMDKWDKLKKHHEEIHKQDTQIIDESMNGNDALEMLRIAREIGINTAEDLIKFYEEHPSFDEHKLETIKTYQDGLGSDFKLPEEERV